MNGERTGLLEVVLTVVLATALIGVCSVVAGAEQDRSKKVLDQKRLGDLFSAVQTIAANNNARRKLNGTAFKDVVGRGFWAACFKQKVLEADMLKKVVSLQSVCNDVAAAEAVVDGDVEFKQENCSYTSPKGQDLMKTLNRRGKDKMIVLCWDSRNWFNGDSGVLVSWSDGEQSIYIDEETCVSEYGISVKDYASPGASVIGKLRPFLLTFEEAECSAATAKLDTEALKPYLKYLDVYKKKGRIWAYRAKAPTGSATPKLQVRWEVDNVDDKTATVSTYTTDTKGEDVPGIDSKKTTTIDLADGRAFAPRGTHIGDKTEEVEAADRKWNCEKWIEGDGGNKVTRWYSVDYPGLVVKEEGAAESILIEFTDPK